MPKFSQNRFYRRRFVDSHYRRNHSLGAFMPTYRHIAYRSRYGMRPYLPPLVSAAVGGLSRAQFQRNLALQRQRLPANAQRLISEFTG
jgi:hypothetical protein